MSLSSMSRTIFNMHTYPFNKKPKDEGISIYGPLFFKWMSVFQSWLDCFSIGV